MAILDRTVVLFLNNLPLHENCGIIHSMMIEKENGMKFGYDKLFYITAWLTGVCFGIGLSMIIQEIAK